MCFPVPCDSPPSHYLFPTQLLNLWPLSLGKGIISTRGSHHKLVLSWFCSFPLCRSSREISNLLLSPEGVNRKPPALESLLPTPQLCHRPVEESLKSEFLDKWNYCRTNQSRSRNVFEVWCSRASLWLTGPPSNPSCRKPASPKELFSTGDIYNLKQRDGEWTQISAEEFSKGSSWEDKPYLVSWIHWWKALACWANSCRSLSFSSCLRCSFCSSSSRSWEGHKAHLREGL